MYGLKAESTPWDILVLLLGNLLGFQSCCQEGRVESTHTWELVYFHTYYAILSFTLLICNIRLKPCSCKAKCYHKCGAQRYQTQKLRRPLKLDLTVSLACDTFPIQPSMTYLDAPAITWNLNNNLEKILEIIKCHCICHLWNILFTPHLSLYHNSKE